MNYSERYNKIRDAIVTSVENGVQLVYGDWGATGTAGQPYKFYEWAEGASAKCGCAVSCMLVQQNVVCNSKADNETDRFIEDAAMFLHASKDWVYELIRSFDGETFDVTYPDAVVMGQELRREFDAVDSDVFADELLGSLQDQVDNQQNYG